MDINKLESFFKGRLPDWEIEVQNDDDDNWVICQGEMDNDMQNTIRLVDGQDDETCESNVSDDKVTFLVRNTEMGRNIFN